MSHYKLLEKYFKLKRAMNVRAVNILKDLEIGPKQASILRCISREGAVSSARLAELTLSDPAAITRSIDILTERGLVSKKDSTTDRRAWVLHLTPKGERIGKQIMRRLEAFSTEIFGKLSAKEISQLSDLLMKMIKVLEELNSENKGEENEPAF